MSIALSCCFVKKKNESFIMHFRRVFVEHVSFLAHAKDLLVPFFYIHFTLIITTYPLKSSVFKYSKHLNYFQTGKDRK